MNKIFLIGNLTRDPELSETQSGISVCRFSIAVNRPYLNDGERETDFFNVTAWRGTAEAVAKFTKKGNKIAIVGSVQMRTYEGNDGVKRTAVDIIAQDIEFLTAKENKQEEKPKAKAKLRAFDDDGDIPF